MLEDGEGETERAKKLKLFITKGHSKWKMVKTVGTKYVARHNERTNEEEKLMI